MKVCRSCLEIVEDLESYALKQSYPNSQCITLQEKCKTCLPEMNFSITNDGVLCSSCYWVFTSFYTLRMKCLNTEEIINNFLRENKFVDLNLLVVPQHLPLPNLNPPSIKVEHTEPNDIVPIQEIPTNPPTTFKKPQTRRFLSLNDSYSFSTTSSVHFTDRKYNARRMKEAPSQIKKVKHSNASRVKIFKCSICSFATSKEHKLDLHMNKHEKAKSYTLRNTSNTTKQGHLSLSLKHAYSSSPAESFQCLLCNFCSNEKGQLKIHMKIHPAKTAFICNLCKRRFVYTGNFKRHLEYHCKANVDVLKM